jgi:uncharacterized protein YijF (DUF1287 family)
MLWFAAILALGLTDHGIFPDLDEQVTLSAPPPAAGARAVLDEKHGLLVIYVAGEPRKAYPTAGTGSLTLGDQAVALRPADVAELLPLVPLLQVHALAAGEKVPGGDRDGDGIPDGLDIAIGARKVALNGARYEGGYTRLAFPGGDVARDTGVCTDVVVRALRNAGLDLQAEVYADIGRAPSAYPMVKRRDPNIDHRRVKTILPWFKRNFRLLPADPRGPDPFLPGDVVFFDTFPSKPGPDHIGVVSDRIGPNGLPLVVNNWTEGYTESEMDLLPVIPVTHRFRVK